MIRHILLFKFKETANGKTKEENLREAKERMLAMRGKIPEILEMTVSFGASGSAPSNYDYILDSTFRSLEELEAYQKHPLHVAFGAFVKELREPGGRACVDIEL